MGSFKHTIKTRRIVGLSLKYEFLNPVLYLFLITVLCYLVYTFGGISTWLSQHEDKLNLFELSTFFGAGYFTGMIYKIGIALFSCGIFFFHPGFSYSLVRMNKKIWVRSQLCYVFCIVLIINLFIFVILFLTSGGHITLDNSWSDAAYTSLSKGPYEVGVEGVAMYYPDLFVYNPNVVGGFNILLMILEGMSIGLLFVLLSLRKKTTYAVAFAFGGYYIDSDLISELYKINPVVKMWSRISPFRVYSIAESTLNIGPNSMIYSVLYGISVITILVILIRKSLDHVSFKKDE